MKKMMLALVAVLLAGSTFAAEHETAIRSAAERMFRAVEARDTTAVANATYPGLTEKMGGRAALIEELSRGFKELTKAGRSVTANTVLEISPVVTAGPELHASVLFTRTVTVPTGKQTRDVFLIAVSSDAGESWTFVDGPQLTPGHIAQLFPEFNPALMIPRVGEPVFIRNGE